MFCFMCFSSGLMDSKQYLSSVIKLSFIFQDRKVPPSSTATLFLMSEIPVTKIRDFGAFPSANSMF